VLLYDHHCPFIGQCLGYYNRKVFQLFLSTRCLAPRLSLVVYLWRLVHPPLSICSTRSRSSDPFETHGSLYLVSALVLVVVQLFVVLVVVFSVGSLMFHQINMLLNNTTTVEYHQYRTERYEAGASFRWRHDLGSGLQNLKACMGQRYSEMLWCHRYRLATDSQCPSATLPDTAARAPSRRATESCVLMCISCATGTVVALWWRLIGAMCDECVCKLFDVE
jgi:hypothetical protein